MELKQSHHSVNSLYFDQVNFVKRTVFELEKKETFKMKAFICLAVVVICNIILSQAAAIVVHGNSVQPLEQGYLDAELFDTIDDHSRQRRAADNGKGQASVDVQKERGRTSVNAQVGRVWESNNGRTTVETNANWGRDFGRGGSKPNYGANILIRHRF